MAVSVTSAAHIRAHETASVERRVIIMPLGRLVCFKTIAMCVYNRALFCVKDFSRAGSLRAPRDVGRLQQLGLGVSVTVSSYCTRVPWYLVLEYSSTRVRCARGGNTGMEKSG